MNNSYAKNIIIRISNALYKMQHTLDEKLWIRHQNKDDKL